MEIMEVRKDGVTEITTFNTIEYLQKKHKEDHIVFFSEGGLFTVHNVTHTGYVYATSANDEHINIHYKSIDRYITIQD